MSSSSDSKEALSDGAIAYGGTNLWVGCTVSVLSSMRVAPTFG